MTSKDRKIATIAQHVFGIGLSPISSQTYVHRVLSDDNGLFDPEFVKDNSEEIISMVLELKRTVSPSKP